MNTLEDIAKMAIEEISTQLASNEEALNGPRPLKAADEVYVEQSLESPQNPQSQQNPQNLSKEVMTPKKQPLNELNANEDDILKINDVKAKSEQKDDLLGERLFLTNLKERAEVLFAGLNTSDENLALRLDLTIRFLEFLLAHTGERLNNLQK